ncbi:helix-turn-helix domain-containing protein [Methylobacterium sp. 391_Methyba4]|uniref:helix-turn-helix domain-containing protein n=1 Tax=Methylobacterium sp. 391_Methyba4 TaxID=3038924 RepID=UPI00241EBC8C|nr:helix-turn-helix transcriptional regulator [Methylobacterium sp. 391_Methyba4]WFS09709.1 helix-turn-helix transcriptional regulator [Methylobacterium sp. 391_Methyba4]
MITPEQCRAARALLNRSQKELAEATGVSLRSIQGFEAGDRVLQSLAMSAVERILESEGIDLINQADWIGVKLRLHQSRA